MGVPEVFYSFDGGLPPEKFCLADHGKLGWQVYYSERGDAVNSKWFKEEGEACEYFLKFITSDDVVMGNLEK